ncbi:DNA polymerase III subunit beta [Leptothermofonsia sichuanensis E412]|uniref:DNA polymerase III subunit beta n=1 Tax=Leptothermofonsia sichuanensis TaxID=2917832 RepID=UPI001CA683B8|nr:DNA polymerase III subunit beta [Leptothermofonsia sichuanensis]QZZ21524.1 DNA polymerase III subunit beta [Leptothermofonsia sichuanensis E412]
MKLVCSQHNLSSNLSLVSRAVSARPSHPILANVLLVADEDTQQVKLSAFDLSLGIQTSFPADVLSGGKLTLPAKLLNDIVSRLPEGEITLDNGEAEIEEEAEEQTGSNPNHLVTLTCSSGRYQVRGMGAEEFPELPVVEDGVVTHLPVEGVIEGVRSSLFAASSDETKQVLTGVHLTIQPDGLEFAATDGHRLAVVQTVNAETINESSESDQKKRKGVKQASGQGTGEQMDVTIPSKALQELTKMLERQAGDSVAVTFDQSQVVFEWADQRLTSRLIEGQYPNYQQLVPRQFARQMTCDRRLLLSALERIAVLADQKNNIVKLTMDSVNQQLSLSVDAQDVGSGKETIPAQITGDDLEIAFNVKYLMDGLKVVTTSEVQMQLNTATSPAIVTPLGGVKMTYLVMPVQIRN